jgi:putative transposase
MALLGVHDDKALSEHHRQWIDDAVKKDFHQRESRWTESVAVGSKAFIEQTRDQLGFRAKGGSVEGLDEVCALREANNDYDFAGKNITLRPENAYFWDAIL